METIVKNGRKTIQGKGEAEMKTMVETKTTDRRTAIEGQPDQKAMPEQPSAERTVVMTERPALPSTAAPQETKADRGLCATCNEALHCAYAENATAPILFCEMFDDSQPQEKTQAGQTVTVTEPDQKNNTKSYLKGLCVNCDHRQTCTFPKPEGGVWHCEEYR